MVSTWRFWGIEIGYCSWYLLGHPPIKLNTSRRNAMSETTIDASVPALVLVVPKSIGASSDSTSNHPDYEEEHDGNVFVGLRFVIIFYAVLAASIATGWKLYHLF